jgi:hypothetical protein
MGPVLFMVRVYVPAVPSVRVTVTVEAVSVSWGAGY